MSRYDFQIPLTFKHRIVFTRDVFSAGLQDLADLFADVAGEKRGLILIEDAVARGRPGLESAAREGMSSIGFEIAGLAVLPGGEQVKSDDALAREVWRLIDAAHLDRHSFIVVIGGGAFLDAVGFAAATAHRGMRLVRVPTTTLAQCDSGVGVKCAINGFGKKNWIGSFAVPYAVVNDFAFLQSLDPITQRAGLIEAVKVALVKDREFFEWIEARLAGLAALEAPLLEACVERSAMLHARHIAEGGDAFESGSSRPLDFGHWAAHKLESMTGGELSHAPAVAIGLALDVLYSVEAGLFSSALAERVLAVISGLGLATFHPALDQRDACGRRVVLDGLEEFREHLGGRLTVMMLGDIGRGVDVHELDTDALGRCIDRLCDMA
ncbi:MAG: 3-dehydroquinate synthase [Verrucomicrobiota bacterium]